MKLEAEVLAARAVARVEQAAPTSPARMERCEIASTVPISRLGSAPANSVVQPAKMKYGAPAKGSNCPSQKSATASITIAMA